MAHTSDQYIQPHSESFIRKINGVLTPTKQELTFQKSHRMVYTSPSNQSHNRYIILTKSVRLNTQKHSQS